MPLSVPRSETISEDPSDLELSGLDWNSALLDRVSGERTEMGQEIRLRARAVACASPSASCEALTLDKGTLMFIVKMLLGKIRLRRVSLAKLLFPTASRQRALNGEPERGGTQRPERRVCRLKLYTRSSSWGSDWAEKFRGKLVSFKIHT